MELLFDRYWSTSVSTISHAIEDNSAFGVALEPPWNNGDNAHGVSAILPGRYQVVPTQSLKHGANWPLLKDVPGRTEVEIHIGNSPRDTEGCTLIGEIAGIDYIHNSTDTFLNLLARIRAAWERGEEVWAEYRNSFTEKNYAVQSTP